MAIELWRGISRHSFTACIQRHISVSFCLVDASTMLDPRRNVCESAS